MAFNYNLPNQNFVYNQGLQQPNPNWYYQPTYSGGYTYNTTTNPTTVPVNAPTNTPTNTPSQPTNPQDNSINWVQGEAGAKSYPVAPGQSAMLMDSENEVFYIKTVDASGMPLPLRIFDYKERFQEKENKEVKESKQTKEIPQIDMSNYITREEFEKRINGINNSRKGRNNNGKSSVQSTE